MEVHEAFAGFSLSPREERSDDLISYQDLAAMLRIDVRRLGAEAGGPVNSLLPQSRQ